MRGRRFRGLLIAGRSRTSGPQRPATADPTRPKAPAQSHIRAARPSAPQAKVPETGPMASMLKKLFKKDDADS